MFVVANPATPPGYNTYLASEDFRFEANNFGFNSARQRRLCLFANAPTIAEATMTNSSGSGTLTIYQTGTSLATDTSLPDRQHGRGKSEHRRDVLSGIGGPDPFNGDIAEVILYNTALSTTNRQTVENYLISKYALCSLAPRRLSTRRRAAMRPRRR